MSRRKRKHTREIKPDPKYGNLLVAKFVNQVMKRGKKDTARRVVYETFDIIAADTKKNPLDVFDIAIRNVGPQVEVKARRIGGANYQVPIEVRGSRKNALAFRWILEAANNKKGKPMAKKLAIEIIEASKKMGIAMKKREDTHRMAEANKAFAHYA